MKYSVNIHEHSNIRNSASKNLKKVIAVITFALVMIFSFNVSAQSGETTPIDLDSGNSIQLEIPKELKSSITDIKNSDVETYMKYSKKYNGYVIISMDKQNKLVSIEVPKSLNLKLQSNNKTGPVLDCYKDCISVDSGGNESSPWICYYLCITGI